MGLEFQIDFTPFERTCEDMVSQLRDFPVKMADELTDWQRDDMHRQYPNTVMTDAKTVQTSIWPRSRAAEKRSAVTGKPRGRPRGVRTSNFGKVASSVRAATGAQRPILRTALYDMLHDRMQKLLTTLHWKVFR